MSFVYDHVRDIDTQLDRLQLASLPSASDRTQASISHAHDQEVSSKLHNLHGLIKLLSVSSAAKPSLTQAAVVISALRQANFSTTVSSQDEAIDSYDQELEWFLVAKATAQTYGLLLEALTRQTLPLSQELWYWDDVLSSYRYTGLYSIQTSPLRLWKWSKSVYHEAQGRGDFVKDGWRNFYGIVQTIIKERSVADMQRRALSPLAEVRSEILKKQTALERAKALNASGIGYLLSNSTGENSSQNTSFGSLSRISSAHQIKNWKMTVYSNIIGMHAVCNAAVSPDLELDKFETTITQYMKEDEPQWHGHDLSKDSTEKASVGVLVTPAEASKRLLHVLEIHLPAFIDHSETIMQQNSRPPRLLRYWLPAVALLLSSSTILRIIVNRKAEITQWIQEFGQTTYDFWQNWVLEPIKNIIGTIRHDEASEVSIMSKRSLEGDRESLTRMVADFAIDNPEGPPLSENQIADIKAGVREGDVTPVLKAYEKDLQSPFMGTVRGNLVRALLIQIQKTKVDVEVAMGGIDSLLKSQQLVFGFVGLTPGILVCIGLFRWVRNLSYQRDNTRKGRKQSISMQTLRHIDRILTNSSQSGTGVLSFREYGLLVCDAIVLRDIAQKSFPSQVFREFLQDFGDLINNSNGVTRQMRIADRIRWAYSKWL